MKNFTTVLIISLCNERFSDLCVRKWKGDFSHWYYSKPVNLSQGNI